MIQALERNKVDDLGLLIEIIKNKNSVIHSDFISFIHKHANQDFVENNSREQWEIFLRDINNMSKVLGGNDKKTNGVAHYKENGTVNVKVKIPLGYPSNTFFGKFLKSLLFLLPKKFREECFGDLSEGRAILEKRGLPSWWVNLITAGNFILVVLAARWNWFQGVFQSAFKFFREFIQ